MHLVYLISLGCRKDLKLCCIIKMLLVSMRKIFMCCGHLNENPTSPPQLRHYGHFLTKICPKSINFDSLLPRLRPSIALELRFSCVEDIWKKTQRRRLSLGTVVNFDQKHPKSIKFFTSKEWCKLFVNEIDFLFYTCPWISTKNKPM